MSVTAIRNKYLATQGPTSILSVVMGRYGGSILAGRIATFADRKTGTVGMFRMPRAIRMTFARESLRTCGYSYLRTLSGSAFAAPARDVTCQYGDRGQGNAGQREGGKFLRLDVVEHEGHQPRDADRRGEANRQAGQRQPEALPHH
jgi:hypothetical protein